MRQEPKPGKKTDLRVIKTYHALNEAFASMLEERSLADITVNDLCNRAGIRRATFYKHFEDKNSFIDYSVRHMHGRFAEEAANGSAGSDKLDVYLLNYIRQALRFLDAHGKLLNRAKETNMLPLLLQILLDETCEGICQRLLEEEAKGMRLPAKPDIMAAFYAGGLYQILIWRLTNAPTMTEDEMLREVAGMFLRM